MISEKYRTFFHELEKNNKKEWFHQNKKSYEEHVRKPFLLLVEKLISYIMEFDSDVSPNPKNTLFRINRDIRFSKEKIPYNTMMKASIAPGGKKSELPGYYIGIDASTIHVGGGLFNLSTASLKKVRSYIAAEPKGLHKIIISKSFVKYFKSLKGERAKRLSPEFNPTLNLVPYIANKQFYAMEELPLNDYINSYKIIPVIMSRFKAIANFNSYLKQALQ